MASIGIDGCRSGWIAAYLNFDIKVERFDNITGLVNHYGNNHSFFIDMPIGLPSLATDNRVCETLARKILAPKRKPSIFNVPCRQAVYAASYSEANKINKEVLNKGLSKQSFFIMPKIREVDEYLIQHKPMRLKIKESHPELAFHFLNNGVSMKFNKKTPEGLDERLQLLQQFDKAVRDAYETALKKFKRKDVANDDIVDAICLAIANKKMDNYKKSSLPLKMIRDEMGLEMGMHFSVLLD